MTPTLTPTPWTPSDKEQVAIALLETLLLMGQEYTEHTIKLMLNRLSRYPVDHVIRSLRQCEKTCRRIYLVDIIDNLPRKRVLVT
jgi:hypothetical protein